MGCGHAQGEPLLAAGGGENFVEVRPEDQVGAADSGLERAEVAIMHKEPVPLPANDRYSVVVDKDVA
jgi:hypothetical protein